MVDLSAESGTGVEKFTKQELDRQKAEIESVMVGGNPGIRQPSAWIPTVAKYRNWKIIGHKDYSLEPTFNYLTGALRGSCIRVLRQYFRQELVLTGTPLVGAQHSTEFGTDAEDVKRIVKIKVNHGRNIDGLKVTSELKTGELKESPLIGYGHGEKDDVVGPFESNEEICAMEGGVAPDGLLRQLCFYTTLGRRFPIGKNTYYGKTDGQEMTPFRLEAPRVRSITGYSGGIVDSVGFRYLDFNSETASPEFLRAIAPYLFPKNVPSVMKMTIAGMLVAGKWRTQGALRMVNEDAARNTLITDLHNHTTDGKYLQGFNDARLVEIAAVIVFLMAAKIHDRAWLQAHSVKEHRDELITFVHGWTDEPEKSLRSFSDTELVSWGFGIEPEAANALGQWQQPKR